jgi:prolyl-tRNA editing enzyme YbaK/EbsC (Cys-tRNA(Pro) deacylase)
MGNGDHHPTVARVVDAGGRAGLVVAPVAFPEGTRTADDAARAIGCTVGQIVKSLVFTLDGDPVVALVSGSNRLDEGRLAALLGGRAVGRADADLVRSATGFAIGGVPPFGHVAPLATAIDEDLCTYDEIWAAAGTPRDVFALTPDDLVRVTGGIVGPLRTD